MDRAGKNGGSAITGYGVRYCEGTATSADSDWADHSVSGTGLMTTITGLTNGTTYQVQVRATNALGDSEWSDSGTGPPVVSAARRLLRGEHLWRLGGRLRRKMGRRSLTMMFGTARVRVRPGPTGALPVLVRRPQ